MKGQFSASAARTLPALAGKLAKLQESATIFLFSTSIQILLSRVLLYLS